MANTEFSVVINNIVKRNSKEITAVDFKNWTNNNIEVRKYIPITEKAVILDKFKDNFLAIGLLTYNNEDYNANYLYMEYNMRLVFDILLRYTNIAIKDEDKTTDNYDLIMESGIYDYIIKKCEKDYTNFVERCDRFLNVGLLLNIKEIFDMMGFSMANGLSEAIEELNNVKEEDAELIKQISDFNNSYVQKRNPDSKKKRAN